MKMHTVTVRYPKHLNGKTNTFERWTRFEKKFKNSSNARAWAEEKNREIEEWKGNRWPVEVRVDSKTVDLAGIFWM